MKVLIIYYSRSGHTKSIADMIGKRLGAVTEEVVDHRSRKGLWGFFVSGREAYAKKIIPIEKLKNDTLLYDLVIVGSPIWAGTICSPIRSFLKEYKDKIPRIAFFTTSGGPDTKNLYLEIKQITAQKPVAVINLAKQDIKKQSYLKMVDNFVTSIKENLKDEK